jgi:hypothetical protein
MFTPLSNPGYMSYETTAKGGFPIIIWYMILERDESVGVMQDSIDDWFITTQSGKKCGWLNISKEDIDGHLNDILKGKANDN